ncbi:MAG: 3-deoxy-D-manno-octulosonic acid transferase [Verrucomicrobia bacterium]|nr:3-deoxy-D-manno-octulosonic acid transferase [Verrucomicrobiota bacterium]MBU4247692.1 3-deoxy-D-manno-octulosonic acid transferase [Verrucomicrobiota bacterium]MBU4290366.1 3-deoxy-D-manno-octulosonic acid transferase [Verrucomicrobiota bacterium]MBU4496682.1 3-deoxy-D-manno-octulosonic acid transferase [Verrucomicrobiota bacterium]MCG2679868.1 3-deoxy-D-manno-octulosonic acid transferase [Kiritimatiellia bacterium]
MIWLFYNCLFPIVYLLMLPRFLIRMRRRGGYCRGFLQRFGIYEPALLARLQARRRTWIHAVSVGEIFVALQFMEAVRTRRPGAAFVLTTNTSTGHAIAEKQIGPEDLLLYFPIDFPPVMRRILNRLNPLALVLVESELWPNLVRQSKRRGIPVMLLNGRLSDRSYPRYRKIRFLTRRLLALIDLFCVQGEEERRRLIDLGADAARIRVMGSAKYDVAAAAPNGLIPAAALLKRAGFSAQARLLVGGSTWPGEETVLLALHQKLRASQPEARLVLVPRHMERAGAVAAEIEKNGLAFRRWSAMGYGTAVSQAAEDVLLVDTTGDLKHFYAAADVIFVGKSLTSHGGQNIIEAAVFAKPIIVGPFMENFRAVIADFLTARAVIQIRDPADLEQAVTDLWTHEEKRRGYGERARQVVQEKAGAIRASVDLFLALGDNP